MRRALILGLAAGTLGFVLLVGVGLLGLSAAFDLALAFSYPFIYVVGPVLGAMAPSGPPGGVMLLPLSAWLELAAIAALGAVIVQRWRPLEPRPSEAK